VSGQAKVPAPAEVLFARLAAEWDADPASVEDRAPTMAVALARLDAATESRGLASLQPAVGGRRPSPRAEPARPSGLPLP
jgi:hypothetical protein